jgi:hypothetical protein
MTNKKHARILLGSIAALGFSSLWAPSAFAVAYTLVPSPTGVPLDWNTNANWTSVGGTIPGAAAADTASLTGDFGGFAQTVDISANLTNPLGALTLGDSAATPSATTVSASNGSVLSLAANANITSAGTAGALNTITAPLVLGGSLNFAFGSTNALSVAGKITPSAAGNRNIDNLTARTVTLGDIDISAGATASTLTIRSGNTTATTVGSHLVLNGTIADGSSVASHLAIGARVGNTTIGISTIQINGTNTYTGNTTLGVQSNANTTFLINSDQPFGPAANGTLTIGNQSGATNIIEAMGSDRTIAKNTLVINRNITFQGSHSLSFPATTLTTSQAFTFVNNITTPGKTVTLGTAGGVMNLNNNNTDLYRLRDFAGGGTTIIPSNIAENSGLAPTAQSKMVVQVSGTGTLLLTGTNTFQGGARITGTGTLQVGNGGTTGSLDSGNGLTPVVNSTAAGAFIQNRSDSVTTNLAINGPVNVTKLGTGSLTLTGSQFHTGTTTVGDGLVASKLVVNGALVAQASTTTNASIVATTANYRTVTLGGADTVATLGLKVGQPVYLSSGGASAASYIDAITGANQFTVFGSGLLAAGSSALTFGEGSALGTSAAVTTVSNLSTLAGAGTISGTVNALAGSFLAPGENDGEAGTLGTGALSLTGATLDFDLAATAAGTSDLIAATGAVSFSSLTFNFDALTAGVLETGVAYDLVSGTSDLIGNVNLISTTFGSGLDGLYVPTYSTGSDGGLNYITVTFAAVPEPASFALLAGMATLGGCLVRRRRGHRA